MFETDVLILGSGLAGSLAAFALSKKGIKVTLVSSIPDEGQAVPYTDPITDFIQPENDPLRCSRAYEFLKESHDELIAQFFSYDILSQPFASVEEIRKLVQENHEINKLSNHLAVELITQERHSTVGSDIYKKPTCLGAYLLNTLNEEVFPVFAKETVIATGGYDGLYLYSTHPSESCGNGLALAHEAGARILNVRNLEFYPTAVKCGDCYRPIPYEILKLWMPKENPASLSRHLFLTSKRTGISHQLLKLTFDHDRIMEKKYPQVFAMIRQLGFDPYREAFPVTPAADVSYGGIVVDKFGQTTVQRLRAVGSAACTGIHGKTFNRSLRLKESVIWTLSCVDDLTNKVRKFAYHFPKIKNPTLRTNEPENAFFEDKLLLLKRMMWENAGIHYDEQSLRVADDVIRQISYDLNRQWGAAKLSPVIVRLKQALYTSKLIIQSLNNC